MATASPPGHALTRRARPGRREWDALAAAAGRRPAPRMLLVVAVALAACAIGLRSAPAMVLGGSCLGGLWRAEGLRRTELALRAQRSARQPPPSSTSRYTFPPVPKLPRKRDRENFLDEVETDMMHPTTCQALGMTPEESQILMKRCRSGVMNFVDFLSITIFLQYLSGEQGSVKRMAMEIDPLDTRTLTERIQVYQTIVRAMTPDDRSHPEAFAHSSPTREANIMRIAEATGYTIERVTQFELDFTCMRDLLLDLGDNDKDIGEAIIDGGLRRTEDEINKSGRAERRRLRRELAKKGEGDTKPDWMTV